MAGASFGPGGSAPVKMAGMVVWLAITASPFIYGGVLWFILSSESWHPIEMNPQTLKYLTFGLYGTAVVLGIVSYKIFDAAGSSVARPRRSFGGEAKAPEPALNPRMVIAWAVAEAVAIEGKGVMETIRGITKQVIERFEL